MPQARIAAPEGRVARRRARVRQRILDAAESLMAERGIDSVTIEDITETADIARRSFYHHFESKHDVLVPLARARTKALNDRIDALVAGIDDPAEVMATAMRHALRELSRDPLCSWFVLKSGLPNERLYEGVGESGLRDVWHGVEVGRFEIVNAEVMKLILSGAFISVLSAHVDRKVDDDDLDDAVENLLRLFGLSPAEAHDLTHRPLRALARSGSSRTKKKGATT